MDKDRKLTAQENATLGLWAIFGFLLLITIGIGIGGALGFLE